MLPRLSGRCHVFLALRGSILTSKLTQTITWTHETCTIEMAATNNILLTPRPATDVRIQIPQQKTLRQLPQRQKVDISFEDLTYTVPQGKSKLKFLNYTLFIWKSVSISVSFVFVCGVNRTLSLADRASFVLTSIVCVSNVEGSIKFIRFSHSYQANKNSCE